jgi:hypothetical protein
MAGTSAWLTNSSFTFPNPLNHNSSSLSISNTPAVSTEYAWILCRAGTKSLREIETVDLKVYLLGAGGYQPSDGWKSSDLKDIFNCIFYYILSFAVLQEKVFHMLPSEIMIFHPCRSAQTIA